MKDIEYVNPVVFEHVYKQLLTVTYQIDPIHDASFTEGFWDKEEGYKRKILKKAIDLMEIQNWEAHRNDCDYIIDKAIQLFWIIPEDNSNNPQNLVSKENYYAAIDVFQKYKKEAATALYGLFCGNDDKKSFELMTKLLSHKKMNDPLSVIAFYFFVKDSNTYVPVRKKGTGERLEKIELSASCIHDGDWQGYKKYLQIISDLQILLQPYHPDVTFLDAQSFLWMLSKISYDTPEYKEPTDPFETIERRELPGSTEGKKEYVYTTRYERDPKIRREFLMNQKKPYTCEVCGMDFESVYGEIGKDLIEVHHKKPLYIDGVEQEVYPTEEYLACLCSNCHRIIHRYKGKIISVEEMKDLFKNHNQ